MLDSKSLFLQISNKWCLHLSVLLLPMTSRDLLYEQLVVAIPRHIQFGQMSDAKKLD